MGLHIYLYRYKKFVTDLEVHNQIQTIAVLIPQTEALVRTAHGTGDEDNTLHDPIRN